MPSLERSSRWRSGRASSSRGTAARSSPPRSRGSGYAGDEALGGAQVDAGLVHASVAVLHLVVHRAQDLVAQAQADAEDGFGRLDGAHGPADGGYGLHAVLRIALTSYSICCGLAARL